MGIVYKAQDIRTGETVALKTVLHGALTGADAIRREIRALRRIPHPGVVSIRSDGINDGSPFYTMALIDGPSLSRVIAERRALDSDSLTVLGRICSTLGFLHAQGIVHGDLTPRNILLRAPLQPVLVDFGLVSYFPAPVGRDVLAHGAVIGGTLAYVSPEQIRGELVDARADLYAFGCILYEMLTGRPPFRASTRNAILRAHLIEAPAPPSSLTDSVPPVLDRLTLQLLAKEPRQRVGYATDIASILADLGAQDWADAPSLSLQPHVYRPAFTGRGSWQNVFRASFERCVEGTGSQFFIGGEPGAGKTRLLTEASNMARKAGLRVIVVQAGAAAQAEDNSDRGPSFSSTGSRSLLYDVAEQCFGEAAASEAVVAEFEQILSHVELQHQSSNPVGLANQGIRIRLFAEVRRMLTTIAATRPVVLIVDDLHWADDLTLEFLQHLPQTFFEATSLVLLATFRNEESNRGLEKLLQMHPNARRVLDRLDYAAVARMIGDMLAVDFVPAGFTSSLASLSRGTPFFIAEYVRTAVASGWITRNRGEWLFLPTPEGGALPMPSSLEQLIRRRLELVPPAARTVLDLASVLGSRLRTDNLAAVFGLDEAKVIDALNELTSRQLLEPSTANELRFTHDQIRETAYRLLPPDQRRRFHQAVAHSLETRPAFCEATSLDAELAFHWSAGEIGEKALYYSERAGERAFASGSYGQAIRHFLSVLRWSEEDANPDIPLDSVRAAGWHRYLGEAYHSLGDVEVSDKHLVQSLRILGIPVPAAGTSQLTFVLRMLLGHFQRAKGFAQTSRELALGHAALAAARLAHSRVWKNDSVSTLVTTLLATHLGESIGVGAPTARPYAQLAFMGGLARLRALERKYFSRARKIATRCNNMSELAHSYYAEAYLRAGEGRWQEARKLSERALSLLEQTDDLPERETALAARGFIARWTGNYDKGLECAEAIRLSAESYGNIEHEVWSIILSAACLFRLGRHGETIEPLRHAASRLRTRSEWVSELRVIAHLAHAYLQTNVEESQRFGMQALSILDRSSGPPLLVSALDAITSLTHVYLALWEHKVELGTTVPPTLIEATLRILNYSHRLAIVFPIARHSYLLFRARKQILESHERAANRSLRLARRAAARLQIPFDNGCLPIRNCGKGVWASGAGCAS